MRLSIDDQALESPLEFVARVHAPQMAGAAMAFSRATYEHSELSLREFEAARFRIAQINGCQLCQNWRSARDTARYVESLGGGASTVASRDLEAPTEAFYAAIAAWRSSELFSARERGAIEFAERFSTDPQGLARDDAFWESMHQLFTDRQIVDLSYCVSCWMALGRLAHVLGIDAACQIPAIAEQRKAS